MDNKKLTDTDLKLWRQVIKSVTPAGEPSPNINSPSQKPDYDEINNYEKRMSQTYQAIIDLHGLTQDDAYSLLLTGLIDYKTIGYNCILVITGVGNMDNNTGVLKRVIPGWMKVEPFLSIVKSTKQAKQEHGGKGALYINL